MQDTNSSNQKFEDLSNIGTRQPLTFIERLTLPLKYFHPATVRAARFRVALCRTAQRPICPSDLL